MALVTQFYTALWFGVCRCFGKPSLRALRPIPVLLVLLLADSCFGVQIISHESAAVSQISLPELRAMYTMRLERWSHGADVQVFVLPQQHPVHLRFCRSVLQALPHQLQAVWYRLVYSGLGRAPVEVQDEAEMLERVRQTPGAIGYIGDGFSLSNVQVLTLEVAP